ncbi:site-specific DNA-methyltransferase [Candidatus Saccharibacteria bacterium]|nr:site-specific DNA-methyltransferase [Candidatus Saccharibacteria bacterium]
MTQQVKFGDCRKLIKSLDDESVNLVVTSPPYNIGKKYGEYKDSVTLEEWKELISDITSEVARVLTPNGSFFLNVSPVPDKKTKEIIPLDSVAYFIAKEHGFYLRNAIVWNFNNMQNPSQRLSGRWESIQWFVKDIDNYVFNLDDIRVPYITKNDKRLDPNGGRNPTDVWYFDRVNNMTKKKLNISEFPCIYPTPMIERIVKMSSSKGDVVLDPFLGSGTTLIACENLDRNGIGFELDRGFEKVIKQRLSNETKIQSKLL